jgi:Protein of unknown function (DUF3592)
MSKKSTQKSPSTAVAAHGRKRRPPTWLDYYSLIFLFICVVLIGPAFFLYVFYADHRDRPSLQWPSASGKIVQCQQESHHGTHSTDYSLNVTYTYTLNGHDYIGHRVAPWSVDLEELNNNQRPSAFAAAHPVGSRVSVYYEPQHPDNAVLLPGPDEPGNRKFMLCGYIALFGGVLLVAMNVKKPAMLRATIRSREARQRPAGPKRPGSLPEGFASYEPGSKPSLSVFPDRECLDEVLGHRGKPLQDWKPDDRVIDAAGREYRLLKRPDKNCYDLDPTGQNWTPDRLMDVAVSTFRANRRNPGALRDLLDSVPEEKRMAVLLKSLDQKTEMPAWFESAFLVFLVVFAIGCGLVAVLIFEFVANHWLL